MTPVRFRLLPAVLAGLTLAAAAGAAPVVLHKDLAAEKLDAHALKAVFLGKKVTWGGAGRIVLAVLKTGPVAEEFFQKSVEMSASAFANHWRRLAMTGGGTAPKTFETEAELRKFVAETPGAIGFLEGTNADASVVSVPLP